MEGHKNKKTENLALHFFNNKSIATFHEVPKYQLLISKWNYFLTS
jgi:hypothetical protein